MTGTNLNWAAIGAVIATLAGVAGTIITPIWGTHLAGEVQAVLMGLSAILIAIPTFHVASVAATKAKYNHLAKMAALRPVPVTVGDLAALHEAR
jgi:ABC-type dipeptide/oligopeptide/nickel transport system permease subunit